MDENAQAELLAELEARFQSLESEFERLDAEADARIKRWRYAEQSAFEVRFDYFRRFNESSGTLVDEEPLSAYVFYAYGYDQADRILCSLVYQTEPEPRICQFYAYNARGIDTAEYRHELHTERYPLLKVGRLVQTQGHPPLLYAEYAQLSAQSNTLIEEYHYDETGRISRISTRTKSWPRPLPSADEQHLRRSLNFMSEMAKAAGTEGQFESVKQSMQEMLAQRSETRSEERYEYEGRTLARIVERHFLTDGTLTGEAIAYEAQRGGETDEMLFEAARVSLKTAIIEQMMKLDAEQRDLPVYCLLLSYDAVADDGLLLDFAPEAQRQAWVLEGEEHSEGSLLYDLLISGGVSVEVVDLPRDYTRFRREHRRRRQWAVIRQLMVAVARNLNHRDWSGSLNTTDDFIVFAHDYEALDNPDNEVIECAPEEKLTIWRAKGFLN